MLWGRGLVSRKRAWHCSLIKGHTPKWLVPPPCTHTNDAVIQKSNYVFFSVQIISFFLKKSSSWIRTFFFFIFHTNFCIIFFFVSFFLIHQKTNILESFLLFFFIILFIEFFIFIFARFHKQDWIGKEMAWHFIFHFLLSLSNQNVSGYLYIFLLLTSFLGCNV